jgi:hypothetical protein
MKTTKELFQNSATTITEQKNHPVYLCSVTLCRNAEDHIHLAFVKPNTT